MESLILQYGSSLDITYEPKLLIRQIYKIIDSATGRQSRIHETGRKVKILFVTPLYEPVWQAGGVVNSISTLCRALVKQGILVSVYTTNACLTDEPLNVPLSRPVNLGGVNVHYFRSTLGPKSLFDSRELIKELRHTAADFDVVYIAAWFMWMAVFQLIQEKNPILRKICSESFSYTGLLKQLLPCA